MTNEPKTPPKGLDKKILRQALDEIIAGGIRLTNKQLMALMVARIHAVEATIGEVLKVEERNRVRLREFEEKIDELCKKMSDRIEENEKNVRRLQNDSISYQLRRKADKNPVMFWLTALLYFVLFSITVISDFRHPILSWLGNMLSGGF